MTLDIGKPFEELLSSLSRFSWLDFEIRDTDGNRRFPSDDHQTDGPDEIEILALSGRIVAHGGFVHGGIHGGDVYGMPISRGNEIVGTIIARYISRQTTGIETSSTTRKTRPIEEVETFLARLARLAEDQMTHQAELEQMAKELTQSFEDLYLYSRIETHGRALHFSETMLKDLVEELMLTMRAQLAFTFLPEVKEYETLIRDISFTADVSDMDAFTRDLVSAIPPDAPSLEEGFFIVNDSAVSDEYRLLHPDPFRFLAVTIGRDDKFFGYLCMVSFNMKEIFRRSEFWLLKSLASSTGAAFENSRLYAESLRIAERERLIRNIFQKYVPEAVANEILQRGERDLIKLGEKRLLTLLNVDIRGYSHMSKRIRPEDMVQVLNYFFMAMGTMVLEYGGILDKYLGDGLLAIFGAPVASANPARDAALAAIGMVEKLEMVNAFSIERYRIPIKIGISIHTGEAIVGNIGFEKKMDYTVIGDVVNDTFRLQNLTREKDNAIFISDTTCERVQPFIEVRFLGMRTLDEDGNEMAVYEVIGKAQT